MADAPLLVDRDDGFTKLTLNRPEKLNAFDSDLVEAMLSAFEQAAADGTRLVSLQGAGRGFSAGFDVSALEAQSDGDLALRFIRLEQLLQTVYHAPFATLALVHGPCWGAAADLVIACSRRIAASCAKFRMPGLRFGVVLGTRRLAERVGSDAARDILETSRTLAAEDAFRMGLLTGLRDVADWPDVMTAAREEALVLPAFSQKALFRLTRTNTCDADMAALARSVAVPGLRDRIVQYAAGLHGGSRA